MNMTITDDLVEAFLKCPTKCFLRSRGEAGAGNAYAAWVRIKNDVFRIEGTKRLVAEVAPDKCAIGIQAMKSLSRLNSMELGAPPQPFGFHQAFTGTPRVRSRS